METGAPVWLHSPTSTWGWLPAVIKHKESIIVKGRHAVKLTLVNDPDVEGVSNASSSAKEGTMNGTFETALTIDPTVKDHPEIKLRNTPKDSSANSDNVHDLITLTHLHEPAILHSLRLRYNEDVIYTSTGPILIAINPFKRMEELYGEEVMERYRLKGEGR